MVPKKHLLKILQLRGCTECKEKTKLLTPFSVSPASKNLPWAQASASGWSAKRGAPEQQLLNMSALSYVGQAKGLPSSLGMFKAFQSLLLSDKAVTKQIDSTELGCFAANQLNYLSLDETKKAKPRSFQLTLEGLWLLFFFFLENISNNLQVWFRATKKISKHTNAQKHSISVCNIFQSERNIMCKHMHTLIVSWIFFLPDILHKKCEPSGLEVCLQYVWKHGKNGILSWNYAFSSRCNVYKEHYITFNNWLLWVLIQATRMFYLPSFPISVCSHMQPCFLEFACFQRPAFQIPVTGQSKLM